VFRRRRREDGTKAAEAPDETYQAPEPAEGDEDYADEDYADEDYAGADDSLGYGADDDTDLGYGSPAVPVGDHEAEGGAYLAGEQPAESRSERHDLGDPATWTRLRDSQAAAPAMARTAGPWDSDGDYPDQPRIDFGSLLVPVRDGYDIQVLMSEEDGVAVAVVHGDSGLQLQPFAAPRSSGLWHEVLPEIVQEVANAGGQSVEQDGPFGPELLARVVPEGAANQRVPPQPLRFLGVDGPRWFLRGLISGPAAVDDDQSQQFRELFADVVVVRGEQAQPPRSPLLVQLPEEARQALEGETAAEQQVQQPKPFNPFERGEHITETR
jgi:Protein of unknown function (DUF3710)